MNLSNSTVVDLKTSCVREPKYFSLWFNIVPAAEIILNILVIVAARRSRKRLRHNFVYAYVANALFANVLFGVSFVYETANRVLSLERLWGSEWPFWLGNNTEDQILKIWWTFRNSFIVSLFLVMSGSISALIYGIRESSYFVGRRIDSNAKDQKVTSRTHRRNKAIVIIVLNWILPFFLNVASAAGWNCVSHCFCVSGQYDPGLYYCQSDKYRECSRFLQPQTNSFLLVCLSIWLLEGIGIVYMLVSTIRKYLNVTKKNRISRLNKIVLQTVAGTSLTPLQNNNKDKENGEKSNVSSARSRADTNDDVFTTTCCSFSNFSYTLKLLIIISILFLVFTAPVMCVIIIDNLTAKYILGFAGVYFPLLCCLFYGILSPIILVHYMSGLRKALIQMFFTWKCCTKVTVTNTRMSTSTQDS